MSQSFEKAIPWIAAVILLAITLYFMPILALSAIAGLLGLALSIAGLLILSPLLKEKLLHNPDEKDKFAMFIEVQEGRSATIMKGGEPIYTIRNHEEEGWKKELTEQPEAQKHLNLGILGTIWGVYQHYIQETVGLHAYVPFFTEPYTQELPRYVVKEKDGKRVYEVLKKDDDGYRTNHLRHQTFTWYFVYKSVDIQKVPFTVIGAAQARIIPGRERAALFQTDSWNVLLDMSLKAVIRSVLRNQVTLDMALGLTSENIDSDQSQSSSKKGESSEELDEGIELRIAQFVYKALAAHKVKRKKFDRSQPADGDVEVSPGEKPSEDEWGLDQFGIDIERIDIIDFTDELPKSERRKFFAAAIGREEGRALHLRGLGEAKAAKAVLAEVIEGGEVAERIISARAFVDGMQGIDSVKGLAGSITQKVLEG